MSVPRPHRFSADEYEQMHEVGIIKETDHVELIRGEIVEMSPVGARHVACVNRTTRSAVRQTDDSVYVQVQGPIRVPTEGMPEPDLALVRATYDQSSQPTAADTLLVVEVSDSSLNHDRSVKLPLYAAAAIPEAWHFNLIANRIERHTDPGPTGYRTVAFAEAGQRLPSTVLPNLVFDSVELLV